MSVRSARRALADVYGHVFQQLENIPAPILLRMQPLLAQAEHELRREVVGWIARQKGRSFSAHMARQALARVKHARAIVDQAAATLAQGLRLAYPQTAMLALGSVEKSIVAQMARFGDPQAPSFDKAAIMLEERGPLFTRYDSSARRYAGTIGDRLRAELALARIRGDSIEGTVQRLLQRMPAVFAGARSSAERIARTETMNAYNVVNLSGIRDWAADQPGALLRWDATYDRRVCVDCAALHGTLIPVEENAKFATRFGRIDHPPLHPNCRCILTPWLERWGKA